MKIAVLADIHANLPAFETVIDHVGRWAPDAVIVLGDVVNRGPRPADCLRLVLERQRSRGWLLLRGNHEDYVIAHARHGYSGVEVELYRNSRWTYEQLDRQVTALQAWPFSLSLSPGGRELRAVHASMRHNRDGIYPETPDEQLQAQIGPRPPAAFVVGHTHKPLVRRLNGTLVVNAGSVGLPFDGDPRACYAQLEYGTGDWRAELVRLEYDRARAERDFVESGFMAEAGPLTRLIWVELRQSRSQIAEWAQAYEPEVMAGHLTVEESVTRFLAAEGISEPAGAWQ